MASTRFRFARLRAPSGAPAPAAHGWLRHVPAVHALSDYTLAALRADLLAGLTIAAVAVPQAVADSVAAGLPVDFGLRSAVVLTAVAALFSSSRHLVHGPTTAVSLALLCALAPVPAAEKASSAVVLAVLVGLIQLAFRAVRPPALSRHLPPEVMLGLMAGICGVLMLEQARSLFGGPLQGDPGDPLLARIWIAASQGLNWGNVGVCLGTMVLVYGSRLLGRRFGVRLPEFLIALVLMAGLAVACSLDARGVRPIGVHSSAGPWFQLPQLSRQRVRELLPSAVAIAWLGLFESLAIARTLAERSGQKLDVSQQCLSEGLANVAGGFFSCMPGSGSFTRSNLNLEAQAATQWAAVFSAVVVAASLWVVVPLTRYIPNAALAALLIVSACRLPDRRLLGQYLRAPDWGAMVALVIALAAIVVSVGFAVRVSIVLSLLQRLRPRLSPVDNTKSQFSADSLAVASLANAVKA
jgi:SulP family sulfate permease